MNNSVPQVTTLDQLKTYANGAIVELPPFADDQPFVARLKRPSLFVLLKEGKIPNQLVKTANNLFSGNTGEIYANDDAMDQVYRVMDVISEACFLEPTWAELKEAGIELTDDQLMFVFTYSQQGVKALNSFRSE